MKEFTFNCPTCGQPILATKDWIGRRMNCPSCNTRIVVPAATQIKKKQPISAGATTKARPRRSRKRPPGFL